MVLTGGAATLRGTVELARDRFRLPVRIGRPRGIGGLTDIVSGPQYAASVGLLLYSLGEDGRVPPVVFRERAEDLQTQPPEANHAPLPTPTPSASVNPGPKPTPQKAAQKGEGTGLMDRIRGLFKDWM